MRHGTRCLIFIVTVARCCGRILLLLLFVLLHFVLHVLAYKRQVLEVFLHDGFLSRQLSELLTVLIDHIQSSIEHADLVFEL